MYIYICIYMYIYIEREREREREREKERERDQFSALKINIILNLCVSDVIRHYREGRRAGYSVGYLQ